MRERRYKKPRLSRKVFLVICEGETEERYVETLRQYFKTPVIIKTRVCGNRITERLVRQYIKELGLDESDDYSVFYMYDGDVIEILQKLLALPGKLLLTNPCIEFWYLLHHQHTNTPLTAEETINRLKRSHTGWSRYSKAHLSQEQIQILLKHSDSAVSRAKKLNWPGNPSSNLYELIDILKNTQNR